MGQITDGTSNTMIVGEQSAHLRDANNNIQRGSYDAVTSQGPHGWTMGCNSSGSGSTPNTDRTFNCTTVRYMINQNGFTTGSAGTCDNMGTNIPLSSSHTGGCCVAMADGTVRFLSDTTVLTTLQYMACRNDGQVITVD